MKAEIKNCIRNLGIKVVRSKTELVWTGKSLNLFPLYTFSSDDLDRTNLVLHEICHYLVASKSRRNIAEFGLGLGPESRIAWHYSYIKDIPEMKLTKNGKAQREETLVCYLQILMNHYLGLNWESVAEMLAFTTDPKRKSLIHEDDDINPSLEVVSASLVKKNLITKEYRLRKWVKDLFK